MADNTVTVVGNVTRDPELRFIQSGQAVTSFGLAVNYRRRIGQSQEFEEKASFFDVTCWSNLAENVAESITKGTRVVVTGRLDQRSWETEQGDKRSKIEIIADEVAPSLRWATAQVHKTERRDGGDFNRGGGGGGYGNRQSPPPAPSNDPFADEEPF